MAKLLSGDLDGGLLPLLAHVSEKDLSNDEAFRNHALAGFQTVGVVKILGDLNCDVHFLNLHDVQILLTSLNKCQEVS